MTRNTWIALAAVTVMSGCVTESENVSTATEQLSVLDWTSDPALGVSNEAALQSPPAVAGTGSSMLSVWPQGYIDDNYTYLYWQYTTRVTSDLPWIPAPVQMFPRATSTAQPSLVAFNGFYYLFYASGVDQYYARFNPSTQQWTGSSRLPFDSNGAPGLAVVGNKLAIVRSEPTNNQLFLRWMDTSEAFSADTAVNYNTLAGDPCPHFTPPPFPTGPGVPFPGATAAQPTAPGVSIAIGFYVNEFSSTPVALAASGSCLYMAHRDSTSTTLVYNTYYNGTWGAKRTVTSGAGGAAQSTAARPALANLAGTLHLVHSDTSVNAYSDMYWSTLSAGSWTAPLTIPGHTTYGAPSMTAVGSRMMMLHEGTAQNSGNIHWSWYIPH